MRMAHPAREYSSGSNVCSTVMQSSLGALVVTKLELPTDSSSSLQLHRRFVFAANSAAWGGALEGIMYRQSVMDTESLPLIMPIRIGPVRKAKKTT